MRSNTGFRSCSDVDENSDNGMINIESPTHSKQQPESVKLKDLIREHAGTIQRIKFDGLVSEEKLNNKEIPQSTRNFKSEMMVENDVPRRATFNQTVHNETFGKKQSCVSESNISIVSVTELHKKRQASAKQLIDEVNLQPGQTNQVCDESNKKESAKQEEAVTIMRTVSITSTQRRTRSVRKQ